MACAGLGALLAMLLTAALNAWLQRDFAREWSASLKVKDARPYGEDEIVRMLRSEEHTSQLQSLMRISYAVFCLKKKKTEHHSTSFTQLIHQQTDTNS